MKKLSILFAMLSLVLPVIGCGGDAGAPNPEAAAEAEKLNTDASYEDQMMGGGEESK